MDTDEPQAVKNPDTPLFSEVDEDYYSPSCHMTKDRTLGINVGGAVIVKPLREWFQALYERDRPLLSDDEFNETQMKREVEQQTKEAVRDSILENCEPKTEYGPHGLHIEWYTADDIEQAIDSAEVK